MCCALQEADRRVNAGRRSEPLRLLAARIYLTPPPRSPSNTAFTTGYGPRSLQLRAASARFVNLLQQPAKRERMRTATGSHLLPHASQIRPITRTWLTSSVQNLSMCDPCVHSATIEQLLPETSSNNAGRLGLLGLRGWGGARIAGGCNRRPFLSAHSCCHAGCTRLSGGRPCQFSYWISWRI